MTEVVLDITKEFNDAYKIVTLQEKLEIATKALRDIQHQTFEEYPIEKGWTLVSDMRTIATNALHDIWRVGKDD